MQPSPFSEAKEMKDYEFLTPDELAAFMKLSKSTVYRLVESRVLPFYRLGGSLRFRKQDVIAYIESKKTQAQNWHL